MDYLTFSTTAIVYDILRENQVKNAKSFNEGNSEDNSEYWVGRWGKFLEL